MIVTIDGWCGAGKSTQSHALARTMGWWYQYVDLKEHGRTDTSVEELLRVYQAVVEKHFDTGIVFDSFWMNLSYFGRDWRRVLEFETRRRMLDVPAIDISIALAVPYHIAAAQHHVRDTGNYDGMNVSKRERKSMPDYFRVRKTARANMAKRVVLVDGTARIDEISRMIVTLLPDNSNSV